MTAKHLWTRKSFSILLIVLFLTSFASPVFAQSGGPVTGTFQTGVAPSATSITICQDIACNTTATTLTPLQTYYIKVSVTEGDTLDDLKTVVLKLWYSGQDVADEAAFDGMTPHEVFGQSFTWTRQTEEVTSTVGATTWESLGLTTNVSDFEETTFDFVFRVTIGKTAEATEIGDRWEVAAKVTDQSNFKNYIAYDDASGSNGLRMDWYGEVQVAEGARVDWGKVKPGMAFTETAAAKSPDQSVTYIANGRFQEEVKSSTTWSTGSYSVALADPSSALQADQFALRASASMVAGNDAEFLIKTFVLPANGSVVAIKESTNIGETGTVETNALYLSLGSSITNPGTYTGTITYTIANAID